MARVGFWELSILKRFNGLKTHPNFMTSATNLKAPTGMQLTLPPFRTGTGEAQVVVRLTTHSSMFTGFGVTGRHQCFTVFSCNT